MDIIICSCIVILSIVAIELLILPNRMNTSNLPKCLVVSEDLTNKSPKDSSNVVRVISDVKMDVFKFQDENIRDFKNWGIPILQWTIDCIK
jgi:hypothetical protein